MLYSLFAAINGKQKYHKEPEGQASKSITSISRKEKKKRG